MQFIIITVAIILVTPISTLANQPQGWWSVPRSRETTTKKGETISDIPIIRKRIYLKLYRGKNDDMPIMIRKHRQGEVKRRRHNSSQPRTITR